MRSTSSSVLVVLFSICSAAIAQDTLPKSAIARFGTPVKVEIGNRIVEHDIESVAFTPDGKLIAAGKRNGTLLMYDLAAAKEVASIKAHDGSINTILRRNKTLLTASMDGTIKEWETTGKAVRTVATIGGGIWTMAISNSGKKLAVAALADDGRLQILDAASGKAVQKLKGPGTTHQLAFAPDDLTLLLAGAEVMQMWNLATSGKQWQRGQELPEGTNAIDSPFYSGVAFSPDKKYAAATVDAQTGAYVLIWDAKTGKGHRRFATRSAHVHFAFSPDGKWLALGGSHPEVAIYHVGTGEIAHDFEKPGERVLSIAFSPDGKRLATGAWDGTATVWDMAVVEKK